MPRVLVDVIDDLRLIMTRDPAADALVDADLELFDGLGLAANGGPKMQIARDLIGDEDGRSLRLDSAHRSREDAMEELILFDRGRGDMRDLKEHVELADLTLELLLRVHELDIFLDHAEKELRVLDGYSGLRRDRGEERFILFCEGAADLIEALNDAEDAPMVVHDRHADRRARPIAGAAIPFRIKAWILIGVGDVEALSARRDLTREPFSDREAQLADLIALGDARPELALLFVEEIDRRAIGLHDGRDLAHHDHEQLVHIERRAEQLHDLLHHAQLGALPLH